MERDQAIAVLKEANLLDTITAGAANDVIARIPDGSLDAVFTDPPYGLGTQVGRMGYFKDVAGDEILDPSWMPGAYRALKDDSPAYIFCKWTNMGEWKAHLEAANFKVANCIIWDKGAHGTGDLLGAWAPQYEMILYCTKGRPLLRKRLPDVIRCPKISPAALVHPYQKPTALIERLLEASIEPNSGSVIVDLFSGSAAIAQAVRRWGCHFVASEIDPQWVELGNKQISKHQTALMPMTSPDSDIVETTIALATPMMF